ncbi:MAG: CDP-glycerol glycerophosphotransferase family protein [Nitrososphaeraceae archaeon]
MVEKVVLVDNITSTHCGDLNTMIVDNSVLFKFSKNEEYLTTSCKNFLNSISCATVDSKTIVEWYQYGNTSLWWFVYRRIWTKIEECLRFIENLKTLIEDIRPQVFVVKGFYDKLDLIKQICVLYNIKLEIPIQSLRKVILQYNLKRKLWKVLVHRYDNKTKNKKIERIGLAKDLIKNSFDASSVRDCVIYLAGSNYRRDIYDWRNDEVISGEHIVQMVLERVIDVSKLLCIDVDYFYSSDNSGLEKRLKDPDKYWIPFEMFITDELQNGSKKPIEYLTKRIIALYEKKEFREAFVYQGIQMWSTLELLFKALMAKIYLPNYILTIEAAKLLLSQVRPKSIFLPYETGVYAMAFIVAAEELGIKTIGMQHGIIHKAHFDYSIDNLRTKTSSVGCPIPTYLLVFGEFYRKLLVETFSYPSDRVITVGNPAYESVPTEIMDSRRQKILLDIGLDPSKKTVLVATSGHQAKYGRGDYDVLIVKALSESLAQMGNDIQVLVKVHPIEDAAEYLKIVREKNAPNLTVIEEYPIQQLIAICDVFVSVLSTTIFEAMVMNKPVIIVEISEKIHRDIMSVGESGAAMRSSFINLSNTILRVIGDSSLRKELSDKSSKAIKYHFNFPSSDINAKIAEILISN